MSGNQDGDVDMKEEVVISDDEVQKEEPKDGEEKSNEDSQPKENGEKPTEKKTAVLKPIVDSLNEHMARLMDLTKSDDVAEEKVSEVCTEARKIKQIADEVILVIMKKKRKAADDKQEYQYVAKIQGLRPQNFKDMRNVLQNALGLGSVKIAPIVRNSPFVDLHFISKDVMEKGLKIVRGKPLGLSLSVVETKMVDKSRLPAECVLNPIDKEYDATATLKDSLLRSRELTEEECKKMREWKEKFIRHALQKMCNDLDSDLYTVVKDRTEGYFYKLEDLRSTPQLETDSERYQTYSGVNPDTGKVEMGYWVLGSDVPSRVPRSQCIRTSLKVLTDFMEASGKPFFDLRVRKGYWDSVMFRSNHSDQCMAVLIVRSGGEANTEKDCEAMKPQLAELFETGPGKDCGVKSIHLKTLSESGRAGNWHLLYGDDYLDDEVAGVKLRLFMNSLFWSDSGCTEQLCETITEELGLDDESGVLEMGVATGLICMYLAKRCKVVCGLDRVQNVLPLAEKNLEINELKNVVLVQGSPTTSVTSLKTHFKECKNVHAFIMETSSNSRNKEEVISMRKSSWIKKVAYLIISYKDVTSTLRLLCSKHADSSEPFVIVKVVPFDIASASLRPDVLVLLERSSALEGKIEKREPKTKPKSTLSSGPPSKRTKPSEAMTTGSRPRSLLGKRLRPPLIQEPAMPESRGYGSRSFGHNSDHASIFNPSRGWQQGGGRRSLASYEAEEAYRMRMEEEEEEARLMEHARLQKEAQLQQIQEVVQLAQQRRLTDALLPTPPVHNIEQVVLTAIKKTGLLDKVAALADIPHTSHMEMEGPGVYSNQQSSENWSSSYDHRSGGESRVSRNENVSRYGRRGSPEYQDRGAYGYGGRRLSPEPRARGSSRYQGRGSFGFQEQDSRRNYYD